MQPYHRDKDTLGTILILPFLIALIIFVAINNCDIETEISDGISTITLEERNVDPAMDKE